MTTTYDALSTEALVETYNLRTGKSVKKGSYTKARMIADLVAMGEIEAQAAADRQDEEDLDAPAQTTLTPVIEETPDEDYDDEAHLIKARLASGECPFCGAEHSSQTAASAVEGTFLGDACNFCHECGKTYNHITGEEVPVGSNGNPKKRRILNPQSKINAKVDGVKALGLEIFYDRPARLWSITDPEGQIDGIYLASRDFSEFTPSELQARAAHHFKKTIR